MYFPLVKILRDNADETVVFNKDMFISTFCQHAAALALVKKRGPGIGVDNKGNGRVQADAPEMTIKTDGFGETSVGLSGVSHQ